MLSGVVPLLETEIVFVFARIVPPLLFVIVPLTASNKFIAFELLARIVPEFVTVNPSVSSPATALAVPSIDAPDSTITVDLLFPLLLFVQY